jgi:hypothetical protein
LASWRKTAQTVTPESHRNGGEVRAGTVICVTAAASGGPNRWVTSVSLIALILGVKIAIGLRTLRTVEYRLANSRAKQVRKGRRHPPMSLRPATQSPGRSNHLRQPLQSPSNHRGMPQGKRRGRSTQQEMTIMLSGEVRCRLRSTREKNLHIRVYYPLNGPGVVVCHNEAHLPLLNKLRG